MTTRATDLPTETELKFALGPGALEILRNGLLSQARIADLHAVYFDTPDARLFRHGYGLRVRRKGDRYFQTLKGGGRGLFVRGEWESETQSATPDPAVLAATPAASIADVQALIPAFEVQVRRESVRASHDGAAIEISLDLGEIRAGYRSEPICELELELLDGAPAALFPFARTLAAPLVLTFETKSERGYRLLGLAMMPPPHEAGLRRLSAAIQAGEPSLVTAALENLGLEPSPGDAGARLLDLAERAAAASEG